MQEFNSLEQLKRAVTVTNTHMRLMAVTCELYLQTTKSSLTALDLVGRLGLLESQTKFVGKSIRDFSENILVTQIPQDENACAFTYRYEENMLEGDYDFLVPELGIVRIRNNGESVGIFGIDDDIPIHTDKDVKLLLKEHGITIY